MKEEQIYTVTMTERDKRALDFLLSADFTPLNGYSYGELLEYLRQYKYYYTIIYDDKRDAIRTNNHYVKQLENFEKKITELENQLAKKSNQVENLKEELFRKLTWKERLLGKIILKL